MGFDGVDLTVRPGGHVLPENVRTDLPKAVKAVRERGLEVNMITTRIEDPDDIVTQYILKTASDLGIKYYRIGSWRYDMDEELMPQLGGINKRLKTLAAMNKNYGMVSGYHNHSGYGYIGGAIWDIHQMMRRLPFEWMGSNYDIGHAVSEGGAGSWAIDFELIAPRITMSAVKDFGWFKDDDGNWDHRFIPMGEGIVPWENVLTKLKGIGFSGPFSTLNMISTVKMKPTNAIKKSRHSPETRKSFVPLLIRYGARKQALQSQTLQSCLLQLM